MNFGLRKNNILFKTSVVFANMKKDGYVSDLYGLLEFNYRYPHSSYRLMSLLRDEGIVETFKEGRKTKYLLTKKGVKVHESVKFIVEMLK